MKLDVLNSKLRDAIIAGDSQGINQISKLIVDLEEMEAKAKMAPMGLPVGGAPVAPGAPLQPQAPVAPPTPEMPVEAPVEAPVAPQEAMPPMGGLGKPTMPMGGQEEVDPLVQQAKGPTPEDLQMQAQEQAQMQEAMILEAQAQKQAHIDSLPDRIIKEVETKKVSLDDLKGGLKPKASLEAKVPREVKRKERTQKEKPIKVANPEGALRPKGSLNQETPKEAPKRNIKDSFNDLAKAEMEAEAVVKENLISKGLSKKQALDSVKSLQTSDEEKMFLSGAVDRLYNDEASKADSAELEELVKPKSSMAAYRLKAKPKSQARSVNLPKGRPNSSL